MPALARLLLALPALAVLPCAALAGSYQFLAAPGIDVNLLYRLDQLTGEVTVCQYGAAEPTKAPFGVTFCHPAGAGAAKQEPGRYELMASRHEKEAGVFRVELLTGMVSNCFLHIGKEGEKVIEDFVVCTPQAK
jgi:hypothetical protein